MQIAPPQLPVVSTKGVKIKLQDGRELIDGISSWWSVAHGYNHPHIKKAIAHQLETLPHVMLAGFANQQTYKLAHQLAQITGLNKVFFSDSGSTAVEVAMKIAGQFFINQKNFQKTKFVSFKNSYHGDTLGAMSLADLESGMHKKFHKFLSKNYSLELPKDENDLNEFEEFIKTHHHKIVAVIIEPLVQCAGGMKFHSGKILKKIHQITKKYHCLFIADECAVGFYRTGKYFAVDHANIKPDIMILGKALTGGFMTLAATLTTDEIYNQFLSPDLNMALMHGPTFMGNALAASAANASLELFAKNNYADKVAKIEQILKRELAKCQNLPRVKEVRVLGAIGVVETDLNWSETFKLRREFIEAGIWLRPFAGVIYVMPPLVIKEADLTKITTAIFNLIIEH